MKKINKLINVLIIASILTLSIVSFNGMVYAENKTGNTNTGSSNTSTVNTTNNSTGNKAGTTTQSTNSSTSSSNNKTTNTSVKSSNANLSNLGIKPNDFKGFKAQTTTYNVTVPNDLDSVTIYATAQDAKASISGTGKKDLSEGTNKFEVVVTAENGATKTYTLNITKSENSENTENVQDQYTGDGLANLSIENLELNPKFDTIVYEYTGKYIGEATSLNINATTTDPYYDIEIIGNENLQEGENIINILVTDPDGNNVAVYQITVNKSLVDEEAIAREKQEEQNRKMMIIGGIIAAVVVIIIIVIIIRKRRNRDWEYWDEEYQEDNLYENDKDIEEQLDNYNYEEEPLTKEQAREKFLNNYNNDVDSEEPYVDEKEQKTRKHKGKRFK